MTTERIRRRTEGRARTTARSGRKIGVGRSKSFLLGAAAWLVGIFFFFPVFWMVLSGFKTELDANSSPKLFFSPTLEQFRAVTADVRGLLGFSEAMINSLVIVGVSTLLVIAMAVPAAYALSIRPIKKARDVLFFFISTKFLPVVAGILPLWIIARDLGVLNTRLVLVILYMGFNLPLAVWMLRSFFREVPVALIEASALDGANLRQQLTNVLLPIVAPGVASTALLVFIFAWNEFFLAVQLNPVDGSTVPIWITTFVSTRGNFLAKLSAASSLAVLPVVIAGWVAQKRMIRGLAMGAVK
jgi:sorbitol/mannitol transport system permease protein